MLKNVLCANIITEIHSHNDCRQWIAALSYEHNSTYLHIETGVEDKVYTEERKKIKNTYLTVFFFIFSL